MYKHVGSLCPEISHTGHLSSAVGDQIPKTADLKYMILKDWNEVRDLRMTKILYEQSEDTSLERLKVTLSINDYLDSKGGQTGISFPNIVDLGDEKISQAVIQVKYAKDPSSPLACGKVQAFTLHDEFGDKIAHIGEIVKKTDDSDPFTYKTQRYSFGQNEFVVGMCMVENLSYISFKYVTFPF